VRVWTGRVITISGLGGHIAVQWEREFKHLWTAYLYTRFMAWYLDHFVIPKHYGWQEVWGLRGLYHEYDRTPLPLGIEWEVSSPRPKKVEA
jgi:hypothetical protein